MSTIDQRIDLLRDTELYSSLGEVEKRILIEDVQGGKVGIYDLVVKYGALEMLMVASEDEMMCDYLIENIVDIFKQTNKYDFDMVVGYIYKNNRTLNKDSVNLLSKETNGMSFVVKELLFDLEKVELQYLVEDSTFINKFNIEEVLLELDGDETKKKEKK